MAKMKQAADQPQQFTTQDGAAKTAMLEAMGDQIGGTQAAQAAT